MSSVFKKNCESGALTEFTLYSDLAFVCLDDLLGYGQTKTAPFRLGGVKWLKDLVENIRGNAITGVGDL